MSAASGSGNIPFDAREFRNALGTFATGVTVVTTVTAGGDPVGLTCNSFSSVSLAPPLVLWSLSLHSPSLSAFLQAPHFAINVLAADQADLSKRFSVSGSHKFEGVKWLASENGPPLLEGALAHLECLSETRHYSGDHVVFIGRVARYAYRSGAPLVFFRGRYSRVME
jgi:flavin reductase (DIM6/NTAB) family NADH-FMN oxidoreductase RutF